MYEYEIDMTQKVDEESSGVLGELIDHLEETGPVEITKDGKRIAVLITPALWEELGSLYVD